VTVVNSAFGGDGLRRQLVDPSQMVMRREIGARSVVAKGKPRTSQMIGTSGLRSWNIGSIRSAHMRLKASIA